MPAVDGLCPNTGDLRAGRGARSDWLHDLHYLFPDYNVSSLKMGPGPLLSEVSHILISVLVHS